ncbi:MAG: hypothetical protein A2252_11650 [Elusimicrobia bacterium RIFOXYA2_FULL_39_19]|nr:MAG: hypothetical protein A2252_11650 [Elusimicrobia bacterium RIFOXYA2_FULL_39_19]
MKKTLTVIILCLLTLTGFLIAQETAPKTVITLEKAVESALANNKNVLIAREKLEQAKGRITEARGAYLPSLTIQGSYNKLSLVPAFTLSIPAGPATITREMKLGAEDNYLLKAVFQETLFTWGRVSNSYAVSKMNFETTKEAYAQVLDETVYNVTKAFYGVILSKKVLEANEEMLKRSQEHQKMVENKFSVGNASQFELLRAKVQVENTKPLVSKSKNAVESSLIALKNMLGIKLSENIEVSGELSYIKEEVSLEASLAAAQKNRPELKIMDLRNQMQQKSLSITKASNKPSLIAVANANYQNPYYYTLDWVNNWSAGIILNYPLFDGFSTNGKVKQSASEQKQVQLQQQQLKEGIEVEIRQLILSQNEAQERIVSQEENIKQAQESLKIAEVGYANGVVTNLEVMDTQLALTQAKINYMQALYDYIITNAGLKKATGNENKSDYVNE